MWIIGGQVFADGAFRPLDVRIEGGVVAELRARESAGRAVCGSSLETGTGTGAAEESRRSEGSGETVCADGCYVLPGLVDIHSHGRAGEDFNFADRQGLQKLCSSYAACGVTAVLGTTMTNEPSAIESAMRKIGEYRAEAHPGARLLGIHMEGPFLGKDKKGAHDERYLRPIDREWFDRLQEASRGSIRLVSLDPRLFGALDFIRDCEADGVRTSLAHTGCDYETALAAADAGCRHVTHLFNAMLPLHHREPGLVGAAIDRAMYAELICDGIHLHPAVIRMMFSLHPEKVVLISDSMQAAGLPDGEYSLGGLTVFVKEKKAALADGTIAGSTTNVYAAMVNAIRFGVPAEQAVASASSIPADSAGLSALAGRIAVGRPADLLVADGSWELKRVYIGGREEETNGAA